MAFHPIIRHLFINRAIWYLVLWFAFISITANLAPYFANDFRYMLIEGTSDFVSSFSDVIVSQYRHYFDWGGRTVAHVIAQSLLYMGKPAHSIIQGICYILLVLFIYYNGRGIAPTFKLNFLSIFFITMMLWICTRSYGEIVFNVVSSSNYLYTTTIILIFLLPFRLSIRKDAYTLPFIFAPLMFILGLMAGWCNENTSAALVCAVGLLNLYHIKRRTLTLWQFTGGIGLLLGFLLLALSPGNAARMDFIEAKGFDFMEHLPRSVEIILSSIVFQFILVVSFFISLFKVRGRMLHVNDTYQYAGSLFLAAIGLLSALIMLASPTVPARSFIGFTVFVTAATVGLSSLISTRGEGLLTPALCKTFVAVACLYSAITMSNTLYCYYEVKQDVKVRESQINSQLDQNIKDLVVTPFRITNSKYLYIADVRASKSHWSNRILKKFYKVDSIRRSCDADGSKIAYDFMPLQFVKPEGICK